MKRTITFIGFLSLLACLSASAQTGCPGCVVDIPAGFPADTVYLEDVPPATQGEYYAEDISFRMPQSTDPLVALDPSIPAGVTINAVEIIAIGNLPAGLSWEANQTYFQVDAGDTDGCIKICGTPLVSGTFTLDIAVLATVAIVTQSASFPLDFEVLPQASNNDGFAMSPTVGCDNLTVDFTNNVPSNGNTGVTYLWDFGDGTQSTEENPAPHTYLSPGEYVVNYEATIDTIGHILSGVTVVASGCSDVPVPPLISGNPDYYIKIFDPAGTEIYNSLPSITDTNAPVSFSMNIQIYPGNYTVEVWDEDSGLLGGDDNCGAVNFSQTTTGTLTNGDLQVSLNIVHPVTTVTSSDTVHVYTSPAAPTVTQTGTDGCAGNMVTLSSSYTDNIQWYNDTVALLGATDPLLEVMETGSYFVTHTSADGCVVTSMPISLTFNELPPAPTYSFNDNYLWANNTDVFPADYSLQWQQDGVDIPGAITAEYCVLETGDYNLIITDNATGCSNAYSLPITYNASAPCALSQADIAGLEGEVGLFPNPTTGSVMVSFSLNESKSVNVGIRDVTGRIVLRQDWGILNGEVRETLPLEGLIPGVYFVRIRLDGEWLTRKLVVR